MIELLNQYGQIWAEFFGLVILQNTVFLGIVFLALYWLRDANAKTKYIITMIGIVKLLLPPFIPASFLAKLFAFSNGIIDVQIGKPIIAGSADQIESTLSLSLIGLLFLIWFLTVSISLFVPIVTTLRLKFKLRDAIPIRFEEINNASIKIYQSEKINMPLTIGIFSNKIFVPAQWDSWSSECRKMILHHELAHIKRRDGIFKLLQMIDQAIYFFHPLVWILNSRINQLREMACDDASVATKRNSSMEYSRYLVKIAEQMTMTELGCSSASALIRQKNELLNRVQYQIKEVAMKHISKKKLGFIVGALMLLIVPFSWTFSNGTPVNPKSENESTLAVKKFEVEKFGKIVGVVKNKKTDKPLEGAEVYLKGTTLKSKTNKKGEFEINNVSPGKYLLVADLDGFKRVIFKNVVVKSNISKKIKINLEPVLVKISETGEGEPPPPPPAKEKLVKVAETKEGDVPPPSPPPKSEKKWIKVAKKGDVPPPPPPIDDEMTWVDYDQPPEVVGGFREVTKVLEYPETARKAGITGTSIVAIQIDEQGKVVKAKITESLHPDCDKAAMEALKSVKWKPALKKGKPVKVWMTVPVNFNLK